MNTLMLSCMHCAVMNYFKVILLPDFTAGCFNSRLSFPYLLSLNCLSSKDLSNNTISEAGKTQMTLRQKSVRNFKLLLSPKVALSVFS